MLAGIGHYVLATFDFLGDQLLLLVRSIAYIAHGRIGLRRTLAQMAVAGTDSIPIVAVTLLFVGMAWGWHTASYMTRFGATGYFGGTTALAIARELGPALCGVVVAARVGSAFAAELGTMIVTEQVDALRALGVSPIRYLVVPRLLAFVTMLPVLTVIADASGVLGAFALGTAQGISTTEFVVSLQRWLAPRDVYGGITKALVFGLIVALVGCRQGLRATGGAAGVGRATISAVVLSIVLIYAANLLLTAAIFRY